MQQSATAGNKGPGSPAGTLRGYHDVLTEAGTMRRSGVGKLVPTFSMKEPAARAVVHQKDRHKVWQEVAKEADRHKPWKEAVAADLLTRAPRRSRSQRR
jgi:hypothetical protein